MGVREWNNVINSVEEFLLTKIITFFLFLVVTGNLDSPRAWVAALHRTKQALNNMKRAFSETVSIPNCSIAKVF